MERTEIKIKLLGRLEDGTSDQELIGEIVGELAQKRSRAKVKRRTLYGSGRDIVQRIKIDLSPDS